MCQARFNVDCPKVLLQTELYKIKFISAQAYDSTLVEYKGVSDRMYNSTTANDRVWNTFGITI